MNLIEQLGGYAAAKEKIESLNEQLYKMMEPERFLLEMDNQQKLSVAISAIEIAMLEHRRQHNIYEAGDWVVLLHTNYRSDVFALTKSFKEIYDEKGMVYRHATDAEIKAGKRL